MATIIGSLRAEATWGEQKVHGLLNDLPNDYIVWPELAVYENYPDFVVLHPTLGLAVLEVKDWTEIVHATPDTFTVRTRAGIERNEPNPLRQTRGKVFAITRKLETRPRLFHASGPHRGKLKIPWTYAVIFPHLTRMLVFHLGEVLEPRYMLCQDDLAPRLFEQRIRDLDWPYATALSDQDVGEIRATLYPELTVKRQSDGAELGVVDILQEQVAKEGLQYSAASSLGDELTEEGHRVATEVRVRLVRGVAGSGKTLVLAMRARYLAKLNPDWRILVVTFNRALAEDLARRMAGMGDNLDVIHFHSICRRWLGKLGVWQNGPVSDSEGRIAHLLQKEFPEITEWTKEFLAAEFAWIKDTGIQDEAAYLDVSRTGRGTRLNRKERASVYAIFRRYEQHLQGQRRYDWADVPLLVLNAMDAHELELERYNAVLVDEAQDFAPTWFEVLRRALNPTAPVMFMAADSTQRIYRSFSWRAMGLNVVGRTRILPRSYRSTYEIMRAAYALVEGKPELVNELREQDEELVEPELDPNWMRHGSIPELRKFKDRADEVGFIAHTIRRLLSEGYTPSDIAVLHRKQYGPGAYQSALIAAGVTEARSLPGDNGQSEAIRFHTIHAVKGLEFRVVFVAQVQTLFSPDRPIQYEERARFEADELRLLYVAMTRARERLYLTYQSALPIPIQALQEYLQAVGEV